MPRPARCSAAGASSAAAEPTRLPLPVLLGALRRRRPSSHPSGADGRGDGSAAARNLRHPHCPRREGLRPGPLPAAHRRQEGQGPHLRLAGWNAVRSILSSAMSRISASSARSRPTSATSRSPWPCPGGTATATHCSAFRWTRPSTGGCRRTAHRPLAHVGETSLRLFARAPPTRITSWLSDVRCGRLVAVLIGSPRAGGAPSPTR